MIKLPKFPILTTGIFFPLYNPNGQKIQNENKKQLGFIYNAISVNNETYVIIATVPSLYNNVHRDFLSALAAMDPIRLSNYLFTYFFSNNDNVVIEPTWFNQLSENFKANLEKLVNLQVGHYGKTAGFSRPLEFNKVILIDNDISVIRNIF